MRSVNGRILVPNPAAKTMALGGKKEDIGVPVAELSYDWPHGTIEGAFREFSLFQCACAGLSTTHRR
jgi:hypothetical protein